MTQERVQELLSVTSALALRIEELDFYPTYQECKRALQQAERMLVDSAKGYELSQAMLTVQIRTLKQHLQNLAAEELATLDRCAAS